MNRLTAALRVLLGKDTSRVVSLKRPEDWNVDSPSGETADAASVLGLSAAWACVNLLAGTQASLPLMVYRTARDGSRDVDTAHPLYRVLHDSPNSLQTAVDFWEFMCASLELWGNAYARKVRSAGNVVGLIPIMPQFPQVTNEGNGRLRYRWSEDGKSFDLTNEDVLHIRGFGGNPLGGMSTLAFGARAFGLALAVDKAAAVTFKNGLRPSGVLTFAEFLTPEQRAEIETKLVEKFMGAMNAGRPMVLEGGSTWAQLGINPEDAQMLESRGFSVEEICRFFGVPPFMIGHTQTSTSWGTGLEQQTLGFQKFALRRRLKRIEQALEKQLLTPQDRAAGVVIEFNLEGLLRGDSAARSVFYTRALGNTQTPGWMVRNEVRRLENLPPVQGWDEPIPLISQATSGRPPDLSRNEDEPMKSLALRDDGAREELMLVKRSDPTLVTKDFALQIKAVEEDGTFEGYGSIFGNLDSQGELVEEGAFAKSLARHVKEKTRPLMLWQHDPWEVIGVWEDLVEDRKGLKVKGRLLKGVRKGEEAHILLKEDAIHGLSIGYREIKVADDGDTRKLLELDLLEISIVSFPANRRARVETVKSILEAGNLPTVREFEEFLRDAGFSKSLATAIAGKATPHLRGEPEAKASDALRFLEKLRA